MSGSITGKILKVSTWGESHGAAIGAVLDGCPAGLTIDEEYIQAFLDRRKPGQSRFTTHRNEKDKVRILSGVFEGKTTGTPISLMIENTDHRSADYSNIKDIVRPGHADYCFNEKYGIRDYRGGGRSSGRETAGRVMAGAVAVRLLSELGIEFLTYVDSVGDISINEDCFDESFIKENPLCMPDRDAYEKASAYLDELMKAGDSSGASVKCIIKNVPVGIGETVFDKLDARLAGAIMSIGAVKAVEIGDGTAVAAARGSVNNDEFYSEEGNVLKKTNHSGGILGGMSDGSDIIIKASFKPTPSIYSEQATVDKDGNNVNINIKGRHDPIVAPRAAVVVETMTALVVADLMLSNMSSKLENVLKIYNR
ncbi:MAG: chorismate synthase [Eubacterium sp.]|nr:chorismate synthase [Eubacterium sp.]